MQGFTDGGGGNWDLVVGRESWGTVVAIFVPRQRGLPVRQTLLETTSAEEGQRLLREMAQDELQALFNASKPKPAG